jgi:hypothetical protein
MFKPEVQECVVEDRGESLTFYVREASGREILRKQKSNKPIEIQARELIEQFVVDAEGNPIDKEKANEMLDYRFAVLQRISQEINEKSGLVRPKDEQDTAKNG